MKLPFRAGIAAATLTALATVAVVAQPVPDISQAQSYPQTSAEKTMTVVDLISMPSKSGGTLSPDGRYILYTAGTPDWELNRIINHIWRMNADGTNPVQMTHGPEGEGGARWSPDGKWFAFLAQRANAEGSQIYIMPIDGGEARALTRHETSPGQFFWARDGGSIYFTAPEPKTPEEKTREKLQDDVIDFENDLKASHLWKASVPDGLTQRLTKGDFHVGSVRLSRDGALLVLTRVADPLLDTSPAGELYVMSSAGGEMTRVTHNNIAEGGAELSPDNSQILFTAQANAQLEYPYNSKLFVVPVGGGPPRLLTNTPYSVGSATWSREGQAIYFSAGMGVHTQLMRIDVATGEIVQLTSGLHGASAEYVPERDEFLLTISTPHNPGELYRMPAAGGQPQRVTRWHEALASEFKLPRTEPTTWKGEDGVEIEGILYYPLGYRPGERYPLVVQTHGGPHAADQMRFPGGIYAYVPVLTAMGYAVLQPNYRGSTGYGDDFMRDMVGGYFRNAHKDVLAGADHLVALGLADPDRLATMGWSAGGHMTNMLIGYTDRFRAASSGAGASNWISMYGQSDVRTYRTPWFGGTPWEKDAPIDAYWDHSPLKYVSNASTPTLFLFGQNDARVPPQQGIEIFRALRSNGVPTHLYLAPRAGHGFSELRHQLFKVNVELDWFERYVTQRSYTWEVAPEPAEDVGIATVR
jgi:dipeptidyl aminopeptidase/acylaminoacyl peptidase